MKKKRSDNGFTLMEVMVAMAILGIAVTVIIELFSGGLRLARKSEDYSRAVFYGRQLLEELCLKKEFSTLEEEGKFEGDYTWRYEIKPELLVEEDREDTFPVELYNIKVLVFWPSGDKQKTLNFETFKTLAKPEETS